MRTSAHITMRSAIPGVDDLIDQYYRGIFESLSDATDAEYEIEKYSSQQATVEFRRTFLESLRSLDEVRWWLAPSHGSVHLRIPCPQCGWAEKRAERTQVIRLYDHSVRIGAECFDHGEYEVEICPDGEHYLDLNTLFRNLVKERALAKDEGTLYVMVKGGDWAFGCQLVDGAHAAMGVAGEKLPPRVFVPQILSDNGAKLSKSLLSDPDGSMMDGIPPWMLNASDWPGSTDSYVDALLWLVDQLTNDPKDFFRSFTTPEIKRLWEMKPENKGPRVRGMAIYKRFFDMIATGEKTIEVRVGYSSMKKIKTGQLIRFECAGKKCLTRVKRVTNYSSFEELLDNEPLKLINPTIDRETQIKELQKIFSKDKEALGVLAIEVEREQDKDNE